MKNSLIIIAIAFTLIACEGNTDPADDNGIDASEIAKTRAEIDSLPSVIKKDYLKSDSIFNLEAKKEIQLLRDEVAKLREEIKTLKKR